MSRGPMKHKAVFVDRDGTLNAMVYDDTHGLFDSPRRPEDVVLKTGAGAFLKALRDRGYYIVIVTNQPGIARGYLTMDALTNVNNRLRDLLRAAGGAWDALYFCPHHPRRMPGRPSPYAKKCRCRKPAPGMLLRAAREHHLDLSGSWMVGDGLNDIAAGRAAGCRTVLVTRLKVEQVERFFDDPSCKPHNIARTLKDALRVIRA